MLLFWKLIRFLAYGIPGLAVAFAVNWTLVALLHTPRPIAYAITLVVQLTVNFFACRWFVFETDPSKGVWPQYVEFVSGMAVFRAIDWLVYTALVEFAGVPYLAAQLANTVLFSILRLKFLERLFGRGAAQKADSHPTESAG